MCVLRSEEQKMGNLSDSELIFEVTEEADGG
jgi:hypothetical protein